MTRVVAAALTLIAALGLSACGGPDRTDSDLAPETVIAARRAIESLHNGTEVQVAS
jgi:hypothetical protein